MLGLARETVVGTYFILLSSEHRPAAMPAIVLQFVFVLLYFSNVFVCLCFPVKHREPVHNACKYVQVQAPRE